MPSRMCRILHLNWDDMMIKAHHWWALIMFMLSLKLEQ